KPSSTVSISLSNTDEVIKPVNIKEKAVNIPIQEEVPMIETVPQIIEVVLEIYDPTPQVPLRRSQREKRLAISNDYQGYLGEADYDIEQIMDPLNFSEVINSS